MQGTSGLKMDNKKGLVLISLPDSAMPVYYEYPYLYENQKIGYNPCKSTPFAASPHRVKKRNSLIDSRQIASICDVAQNGADPDSARQHRRNLIPLFLACQHMRPSAPSRVKMNAHTAPLPARPDAEESPLSH
jgi:hypothetical protein